jgi:hypothetical protein
MDYEKNTNSPKKNKQTKNGIGLFQGNKRFGEVKVVISGQQTCTLGGTEATLSVKNPTMLNSTDR